jgi:hypothetical protein
MLFFGKESPPVRTGGAARSRGLASLLADDLHDPRRAEDLVPLQGLAPTVQARGEEDLGAGVQVAAAERALHEEGSAAECAAVRSLEAGSRQPDKGDHRLHDDARLLEGRRADRRAHRDEALRRRGTSWRGDRDLRPHRLSRRRGVRESTILRISPRFSSGAGGVILGRLRAVRLESSRVVGWKGESS